jgi:hypothetical protein
MDAGEPYHTMVRQASRWEAGPWPMLRQAVPMPSLRFVWLCMDSNMELLSRTGTSMLGYTPPAGAADQYAITHCRCLG